MASKKNVKARKNVKQMPKKTDDNKVIKIVIAIIAILIILFAVVSCVKKINSNSENGKTGNTKNKTEKKERKKKTIDVVDDVYIPTNISYVRPMVFNKTAAVQAAKEEADTTEPVVTLVGDEAIGIELGVDVYEEQGATWTDNKDGSGTITEPTRITLDGSSVQFVANDIPGEYTLIYSYTDAAGNTGIATRTVTVSDNLGPEVEATFVTSANTSNSPYNVGTGFATYSFNASDQSSVSLVKIAKEDTNIEQNGEWFENNGDELTLPYEYNLTENGKYIVYAVDSLGNESFTQFDVIEVPTPSTNGNVTTWTRNIILGSKDDKYSNVMVYSNSSRFKNGTTPRNAEIADFENPANQSKITSLGDNNDKNYVEITWATDDNSTHWNYIKYDRTTTDEDGNETTEYNIITGPHCATGIDNN